MTSNKQKFPYFLYKHSKVTQNFKHEAPVRFRLILRLWLRKNQRDKKKFLIESGCLLHPSHRSNTHLVYLSVAQYPGHVSPLIKISSPMISFQRTIYHSQKSFHSYGHPPLRQSLRLSLTERGDFTPVCKQGTFANRAVFDHGVRLRPKHDWDVGLMDGYYTSSHDSINADMTFVSR